MGINDLLSFEDDENNESQEDVAEETLPVAEVDLEPEEETVEVVAVDDNEEDYVDNFDAWEDDLEPTSGVVTVSIHVDPDTITSDDVPEIGIMMLLGGLQQQFGEPWVEFIDSAPGENTWDITFRVAPQATRFEMLPALQSMGQALLRPRTGANGQMTGDIMPASTSAEYVY